MSIGSIEDGFYDTLGILSYPPPPPCSLLIHLLFLAPPSSHDCGKGEGRNQQFFKGKVFREEVRTEGERRE
jgi:hypothetical protein